MDPCPVMYWSHFPQICRDKIFLVRRNNLNFDENKDYARKLLFLARIPDYGRLKLKAEARPTYSSQWIPAPFSMRNPLTSVVLMRFQVDND